MKKLTKKEIYDHFTFCIEVEEESGYRYWITCEGYEEWENTAKKISDEGKLSDMDFCTKHTYPGMQEFYDGFYEWSYTTGNHCVNDYYNTVYAVA